MLEVYHGFITKFITDLSRNLSHITVLCSSHARSVQAHSAHACLAHACLAHVSLSPRFARPTLCSCHALHSRTTHARGLHATVSQLGFPTHQHAPAPLAGGQLLYMQAPLAGGHNAGATCGRTTVPCPEWQGPTLGVVLKSTGYWGCWRIEHRCSGGYQSSTCATVPTIPLACKADTASAGKKQGVTGTGARGIPGMPNISARVSGLLFSSHPIELFFDSAFKLPEVRGKQCTGE